MQWESKAKRFGVVLGSSRLLQFEPDPKSGFGLLDSGNEVVQHLTGLNQKAIDEKLKERKDYLRRIPGRSGIWPRDERLSAEQKAMKQDLRGDVYGELDEEDLRRILGKRKIAFPASAPKARLIELLTASTQAANGDKADAEAGSKAPKARATDGRITLQALMALGLIAIVALWCAPQLRAERALAWWTNYTAQAVLYGTPDTSNCVVTATLSGSQVRTVVDVQLDAGAPTNVVVGLGNTISSNQTDILQSIAPGESYRFYLGDGYRGNVAAKSVATNAATPYNLRIFEGGDL